MQAKERIQKVLSQYGYGSRREIERLIGLEAIKINNKIAQLGDKISLDDVITIDNKRVQFDKKLVQKTRMLIYYKPVGEVCSRNDPKFTKTVFDNLPTLKNSRWIQIGRLDLNTSGLLIFTNNGDLAHRMMHPSFEVEREYAVRVCGQVTNEIINKLKKGVKLEDGMAKFKSITYQGGENLNSWYHVTLTEGRQREVRRLWQSQGLEVSRLIRIRFGSITLPRFLSQGRWIEMQANEVERFTAQILYG
ncbi:MAG: 23S rRNA pseudouridylate synthase B [Legionellales bacterium RIFCSPHIGHO2_12_FULL_37_14]|nr:MAG: 23S rRNA pseudouridylate synthase B [Legionellales bacterium RIFCSPHIGHO2_12_FULL_37_14]